MWTEWTRCGAQLWTADEISSTSKRNPMCCVGHGGWLRSNHSISTVHIRGTATCVDSAMSRSLTLRCRSRDNRNYRLLVARFHHIKYKWSLHRPHINNVRRKQTAINYSAIGLLAPLARTSNFSQTPVSCHQTEIRRFTHWPWGPSRGGSHPPASSPGNRAECYAELVVSNPAVAGAETITSTYCTDSQMVGLRLRNDLYCVEWGVKLYSLTHWPGWVAWKILPKVVTHPSTNRVWHSLTLLVWRTPHHQWLF